jgi:hypothetical protein
METKSRNLLSGLEAKLLLSRCFTAPFDEDAAERYDSASSLLLSELTPLITTQANTSFVAKLRFERPFASANGTGRLLY